MRRLLNSLLLCCNLMFIFTSAMSAQQPLTGTNHNSAGNIFDALSASNPREGVVTIEQSESIRSRVGKVSLRGNAVLGQDGNVTIVSGFRIQAYNGNMRNSKEEVYARMNKIRQILPEYNCYIQYKAPFWRLLVGDFLTSQEAVEVSSRLKTALPHVSKEVYIVKDRVNIKNYSDINEQL